MTDAIDLAQQLTARAFHADPSTSDWRVVGDGACTLFRTRTIAESARLVAAIAALPGVEDHRPDLRRPPGWRHGQAADRRPTTGTGVTGHDVDLARRISAAARELGVPADPSDVQSILFVVGAHARPRVDGLLAAIFGYIDRPDSPDEDLVDPRGRGPAIWFESPRRAGDGPPRRHPRGGLGPAGGGPAARRRGPGRGWPDGPRHFAPMSWTLSDPEGNEADVATLLERD